MLFGKFKDDCKKYWDNYFAFIAKNEANIRSSGTPLYPSHILFMNFGDQYGMELLGAEAKPKPLIPKITKFNNVDGYFNLFNDETNEPHFNFAGSNHGMSNLCLIQEGDLSIAQERFSYIDLYPSKLMRSGGRGAAVEFTPSFKSGFFERCAIVNHKEGLFRCKNILFLAIFTNKIKSPELRNFFQRILEKRDEINQLTIHGIFTAGKDDVAILKASQLQNLYLSTGVHETTIGDFLNQSPEILKSVFKTDHYVYEPTLRWLQHDGSVADTAINPDLFIRRADGEYDIIDLKLAGLTKKKMTKGRRNRRRFIDYVAEGIAQLANYKFYFSFEENQQFAFEKYGIVTKKPNLTLVVGSMENVDHSEIIEALRPHEGMNYNIIDYDTLVSIYITGESSALKLASN